jgi:hypothetical protein
MPKFFLLILAVTGCLLAGVATGADFPVPRDIGLFRTYACPLAAKTPIIDGRLDDAAWSHAEWTEDFIDIQGSELPAPRLRTRAKMLWDSEFFYIAAQLGEPHVWGSLTDRDAVIYHDNDFEVFIDPDGDNHLYYELEINALGTEWDLLLIKPYRDGAPAVNAWDIQGLRTGIDVQGTRNDPSDTDTGWSVEIAIPWPVLAQCAGRPSPPEPGDIWRVNFSRVQWRTRIEDGRYVKLTDPQTGKWLPEDNWVWSPQGLIAMHYPEQWGEVMFVGADFDGNLKRSLSNSSEHMAILVGRVLMDLYYAQRQWQQDHGTFAAALEELEFTPRLMTRDWQLEMSGQASRFQARLTTPDFVITVDEQGRLLRDPLNPGEVKP